MKIAPHLDRRIAAAVCRPPPLCARRLGRLTNLNVRAHDQGGCPHGATSKLAVRSARKVGATSRRRRQPVVNPASARVRHAVRHAPAARPPRPRRRRVGAGAIPRAERRACTPPEPRCARARAACTRARARVRPRHGRRLTCARARADAARADGAGLASAAPVMTEQDVLAAQKKWSDGVVAIGKAYLEGGDYKGLATAAASTIYGYDYGKVLFKPTRCAEVPFRPTPSDALSYFVGGHYPEDTGFAIQPWSAISWHNHDIYTCGEIGIAMGECARARRVPRARGVRGGVRGQPPSCARARSTRSRRRPCRRRRTGAGTSSQTPRRPPSPRSSTRSATASTRTARCAYSCTTRPSRSSPREPRARAMGRASGSRPRRRGACAANRASTDLRCRLLMKT